MMIFQYSNNPGLINSQKEKFNSINLLNLLERFPSAPLPIVGVFDGVEAGRRQGHPVRGRLRHGARESLGCQIALLLLALVQSQPVRPQGRPRQIRQCVRQISSNIEILHNSNIAFRYPQMTWPRSCAKETPVQTRAAQRRAKCVTIIGYPSLSPPRRPRPCTFASSAPTRFTDLIPIKCSTIFYTLCSKCQWYARTRWVCSKFHFSRSFNLDRNISSSSIIGSRSSLRVILCKAWNG